MGFEVNNGQKCRAGEPVKKSCPTNDIHGFSEQKVIHIQDCRRPLRRYVLYQRIACARHMSKRRPAQHAHVQQSDLETSLPASCRVSNAMHPVFPITSKPDRTQHLTVECMYPQATGCSSRGWTHRMLLVLNAGATPLRTALQWLSVCPVSRLMPPRNCTAHRQA